MAQTVVAPRSQHDRNLTIRIYGSGGPMTQLTFPIKPKEFQRDTPARVSTTQTMQGVYQDFGGLGVTTLIYQGNTGWRRRPPHPTVDGFGVFQALYQGIYLEYHARIQRVGDPEKVHCIVIDDLYDTVYRVSLDDFQATKSVSETLMYNYALHMTVIATSQDARSPIDYSGLPILSAGNIPNRVQNALKTTGQYQPVSARTYIVKSGDSLWTIAVQYYSDGTQDKKIARANGIIPPYTIYAGEKLTIPY